MSTFSEQQKQRCKEAFLLYDVGDGTIKADQLGEVMRCAGANPSEKEASTFCKGKSTVSFVDFLSLMATQEIGKDPTEELEEAFGIFDVFGDGSLEASTLRHTLTNLGESFTGEEITELLRIVDPDPNGRIKISDIIGFAARHK